MNLQELPRTLSRRLIGSSLAAARLPLDVAARVSGHEDDEQWAPVLTFEGVGAGVETVLGSLLRDEALVTNGRLRQEKVAQLRRAAALEVVAETGREQAAQQFTEQQQQAEARRRQAEQRARRREQQAEQEAKQQTRAAEQKAARKTAAARAAQAAQEEAIERRERAVATKSLAEEAAALEAQKAALEAADTVAVIDDTIEGTKAARKSV
jgi:hypothetical protein